MTDLVKRLRGFAGVADCHDAAERIEVLECELKLAYAAVEKLKAENAALKDRLNYALASVAGVDALRADAERYRWLRNATSFNKQGKAFALNPDLWDDLCDLVGEDFDEAIDKARNP